MAVNYKNYPVLSTLIQAGGWLEVSRILASVQRSLENAYVWSAAKAGKRVTAADPELTKLIHPRKIHTLNLFGFVDEVRRLDTALAELVEATNCKDKFTDFDAACICAFDEITLPDYLNNVLDHLFTSTTPVEKDYFIFEAENFPCYKLKFKDRDTLVDFVTHCRIEGVVYKHVEKVEYDKCQGYVEEDDYSDITTAKRVSYLADALRVLPFYIQPDDENKYLFHTPDSGNYLVLTETEETAYAKQILQDDMLSNCKILDETYWTDYIKCEFPDEQALRDETTYKAWFSDPNKFEMDHFLKDHFENVCDVLYRNSEGIVILIEDPVVVKAFPQTENTDAFGEETKPVETKRSTRKKTATNNTENTNIE